MKSTQVFQKRPAFQRPAPLFSPPLVEEHPRLLVYVSANLYNRFGKGLLRDGSRETGWEERRECSVGDAEHHEALPRRRGTRRGGLRAREGRGPRAAGGEWRRQEHPREDARGRLLARRG